MNGRKTKTFRRSLRRLTGAVALAFLLVATQLPLSALGTGVPDGAYEATPAQAAQAAGPQVQLDAATAPTPEPNAGSGDPAPAEGSDNEGTGGPASPSEGPAPDGAPPADASDDDAGDAADGGAGILLESSEGDVQREAPEVNATETPTVPSDNQGSGTTGGVSWFIRSASDANRPGELYIYPTDGISGTMADTAAEGSASWFTKKDAVQSVYVEPGVSAGAQAAYLFEKLANCTAMDLSNLDTSGTWNMYGTFRECTRLPSSSLTLPAGFGSAATNMGHMFYKCSSLVSPEFPVGFGASAERMHSMFQFCEALKSPVFPAGFGAGASNVVYMFAYCHSLASPAFPGSFGASAAEMTGMFQKCYALESPAFPDGFGASAEKMDEMFVECTSLASPSFPEGFGSKAENMFCMFLSCTSLASPSFPEGFGSKATNMHNMFRTCSALTLSSFPSAFGIKATNMNSMFYGCTRLSSLTLPGGFGSAATSMEYMFSNCTSLSLPSFPDGFGGKATNMIALFDGCTVLSSPVFPESFGGKATNMSYMFRNCASLVSPAFSDGFGIAAISMQAMFLGCTSLVDPSFPDSFGIAATNISSMFKSCTSLASPVFPDGFGSLANGEESGMYAMFQGCTSLSSPSFPAGFGGAATDMGWMFDGCKALSSLTLPSGFGSGATRVTDMFYLCGSMTSITLVGSCGVEVKKQLPYAKDDPMHTGLWVKRGDPNGAGVVKTGLQDNSSYVPQLNQNLQPPADAHASGTCGDGGVAWYITNLSAAASPGKLVIYPTNGRSGTMRNYMSDRLNDGENTAPWLAQGYAEVIKSAYVAPGVKAGEYAFYLFARQTNNRSIDASNLDASGTRGASWMFMDCRSLTSLSLPAAGFGFPADAGVDGMFAFCGSLVSLTLPSGFGTESEYMPEVFISCYNLKFLALPENFASKATNIQNMFSGCESLASLKLPAGFGSMLASGGPNAADRAFSQCFAIRQFDLPGSFAYESIMNLPSPNESIVEGGHYTGKWLSTLGDTVDHGDFARNTPAVYTAEFIAPPTAPVITGVSLSVNGLLKIEYTARASARAPYMYIYYEYRVGATGTWHGLLDEQRELTEPTDITFTQLLDAGAITGDDIYVRVTARNVFGETATSGVKSMTFQISFTAPVSMECAVLADGSIVPPGNQKLVNTCSWGLRLKSVSMRQVDPEHHPVTAWTLYGGDTANGSPLWTGYSDGGGLDLYRSGQVILPNGGTMPYTWTATGVSDATPFVGDEPVDYATITYTVAMAVVQ